MAASQTLYKYLPVWTQNLALSHYGKQQARIRFSPYFHEKLAWLRESEWWSASDIAAYKDEQVQRVVRHAYETTAYYRERMTALGLTPEDIRGVADLPKLPILTKQDVREAGASLISTAFPPSNLVHSHTSGTTGTGLHVVKTREEAAYQWAIWWRFRERFGARFGDEHVSFTGQPSSPVKQKRPPFWRYNRAFNQHLIGMQHLHPDKIGSIVDFLNSIKPVFYTGYPGVIGEVARVALRGNHLLSPDARPKMVFFGSENALPWHYDLIRKWTGVDPVDQYGANEGALNLSRCKENVYHEDFEFGHLEIESAGVDAEGNQLGQVIATGFASDAQPYIRYRLGDVLKLPANPEPCACGRHSTVVIGIDGRNEDYIVTPEGNRLRHVSHVFKVASFIEEAQIVQHEPTSILIRLVPNQSYQPDRDHAILRKQIAKYVSASLKVDFEVVDRIEREPNGKSRVIRSYL